MRWAELLADAEKPPGLLARDAVVRTFPTPDFKGMTFYEIRAKSIINRVAASSRMPFQWTINPYRGCGHRCRYCFARPTHDYLGLNIGEDFDSKVVVKTNAPELLKSELGRRSWHGEPIAMGTNVDPYQRAEGKYRLMRGILEVLSEYQNPFSILTKGTLILRDLDLIRAAAGHASVRIGVSIGFVDRVVWREVESGAPSPQARLRLCRSLTEAGVACNVLMAPILPFLTDSDEQLDATVTAIAATGARSITPLVLHLRPGVREWFLEWLASSRPRLVRDYQQLYSRGAYAPREYTADVTRRVALLARARGMADGRVAPDRVDEPANQAANAAQATQLSLL